MNEQRKITENNFNLFILKGNKIKNCFYQILRSIQKNKKQNILMIAKSNEETNNNNNEANKNLLSEIIGFWEIIENNLSEIKDFLNIINKNEYVINSEFYNKFYPMNYNRNYENNNLNILIYKNLIDIPNNIILKDMIRKKRFISDSIRLRKRNAFLKENKFAEIKPANDCIIQFIENNFIEYISEIQNKKKKKIQNNNIFFNCKINSSKTIAEISIGILIFNIWIKIPLNKEYNLTNYYDKIIFLINFNYDKPDNLFIENRLNQEELYHKLEKKSYNKNLLKNNYILLKKIKKLLEFRIYSIIKKIIDETKLFRKNNIFDDFILIEFCKRFIFYIHDYNQLFKTKCQICEKIVKYSAKEKCFFPPYMKVYKEKEYIFFKNENLFYHEECFRRIALPSL